MSRISNCSNFIIIETQRLNFIKNKTGKVKEVENNHYFNSVEEIDISLFDRKEVALLIPFNQLFIENFFLPVHAREKLDEVIRLKFFKQLAFQESDLYFSYYVDDRLGDDKLNVVCYAVKKIVVDRVYNLLVDKGIKVKHILPLPLFSYIYHIEQDEKYLKHIYKTNLEREDSCSKKQAVLYLDRLSGHLAFTVFHSEGIYLRSGGLENFSRELDRTIRYLEDYLKISEIEIYNNDSKVVEIGELIDNTESNQKHLKDRFSAILGDIKINKADLNSLDLLHQIPGEKKKKRNRYRVIISLIIFLILVSNIFSLTTYLQLKKDRLDFNKGQLLELEPAMGQLQKLQNQIDVQTEQLKIYTGIVESRQSYLPWIYELSKQLPDNVKIDHLNFKGDSMILLDGFAPSASKVMETLEDSDIFTNLEFIGGIAIDENGERFRIAGDLINE